MKKTFSTSWKKSKQPRKQRKYQYNAPLHLKGRFLNASLSKELSKKNEVSKLRARVNDTVKIMRGKFKNKEGKIEAVNVKKSTVYVTGVDVMKKDGSKGKVPIHASNVMIIGLGSTDKTRIVKKDSSKKSTESN
jgi:large subunit ribosomal protein L24